MRYWQDGSHARLRIRDLAPEAADAVGGELEARPAYVNAGSPAERRLDQQTYLAMAAGIAAVGEGTDRCPSGGCGPAASTASATNPSWSGTAGRN
ncbi:MAG TPA: hypothetical protein VJT49_07990 [Amycolatopsis sp.]|uniref:hypothetical protein n=1 Tax=Amycolatopsis sp. TaxID=37632 RepID=UPI002B493D33|nr:hypothetical protein [Amycolatopsis sp.]HKS45047.1 hypothetical protein [Amycolatopsis sp.]